MIKQKESIITIIALKGEEIAINILPTGARKSILFILLGIIYNTGISIIIILFIALIKDLIGQATKIGINCIQFIIAINIKREILSRAARLVIISADIVISDRFLIYINEL